jgi:hypothetical protein
VPELNSGNFQRPKQLPQGALLTFETDGRIRPGGELAWPPSDTQFRYNKETEGSGTRGRVCPCGCCLKSTLEYFNVLNNTVKGCHSLLTWVLGLGQGASSRVPNLTRNSWYEWKRKVAGRGVVRALAACV